MNNTYDHSIGLATDLFVRVKDAGGMEDLSGFLRIRRELSYFLLNLNHSSQADAAGQQIHFLFIAIGHLDNIDKEMRISFSGEELNSLERIHDKIRSLKVLILQYIRHLMSES